MKTIGVRSDKRCGKNEIGGGMKIKTHKIYFLFSLPEYIELDRSDVF